MHTVLRMRQYAKLYVHDSPDSTHARDFLLHVIPHDTTHAQYNTGSLLIARRVTVYAIQFILLLSYPPRKVHTGDRDKEHYGEVSGLLDSIPSPTEGLRAPGPTTKLHTPNVSA